MKPEPMAPSEAEHKPGVGSVLPDLDDLIAVVEGEQRFVPVKLHQRLFRLDRVRIDDLVPDPLIPFLFRHVLDVFVDHSEFRH